MLSTKTAGMLTAAIVALVGTTAFAQNGPAQPAPMATQQVAYYADDVVAEGSCCSPECCEPAACSACDACGCDTECGGGCDLGEPWTLFGESCTGITAGGWISSGIYGNAYGAASNGPLGFNNVGDGFTLNQLGSMPRRQPTPADAASTGVSASTTSSASTAPTPRPSAASGWDNDWDTQPRLRLGHAAALRRVGHQQSDHQGRPLLHAHRLGSRSGPRQLLLHPLLHHVLRRAVHPHRRAWPRTSSTTT